MAGLVLSKVRLFPARGVGGVGAPGQGVLLAALQVVLVSGRDLLGLVARQLDAATHVRCDVSLEAAFAKQRIYCLNLVPT